MEAKFVARCRILAAFAPLVAALLLLRAAWLWSAFDNRLLPHYLLQGIGVSPEAMAAWQLPVAALVANLPLLLVCLALLRATHIFRMVARGERITTGVIRHLAGAASLIFWAALVKIPAEAVVSVLLTINNPVGERSLRLAFSSAELVGIVAAGLLWALAATLREALAIRQENDAFV